MNRPPLSVLVPCFNNEDIIEECLRSVAWADEIVVCDSFSTDRTLEIASRYAHRILQHEYRNSASQKNWAIPQVANEWVLIVDSDERVSRALRDDIEEALAMDVGIAGYNIPRANHLFGRWLRHGNNWPDYQMRLFQRDRGRYQDREVHAHVILDGHAGALESPLLHFPHRSLRNLNRVILQRYTTWEAIERWRQGVRFTWLQFTARPVAAFFYRYLVRQGFRDSWQGWLMSVIWAWYVAITYGKVRRLERGETL